MHKFTNGTSYTTHNDGDYKVISRTAKRMKVMDQFGAVKTVGVLIDERDPERGEWARPEGKYSMCPVIRAERPLD